MGRNKLIQTIDFLKYIFLQSREDHLIYIYINTYSILPRCLQDEGNGKSKYQVLYLSTVYIVSSEMMVSWSSAVGKGDKRR